MADQCIQHGEEMVGAGHPTKDDTLNRLALVETDIDGKGKYRYLKDQGSDPATGAGEIVIYSKAGVPYYRAPSNGAVSRLGGLPLASTPQPVSVTVNGGTGNYDVTITAVDTTRAIIIPYFVGGSTAGGAFSRQVAGYWTFNGSTTARFVCAGSGGSGDLNVLGLVLEFTSAATINLVSQSCSMSSSEGTTDTTVTSYNNADAFCIQDYVDSGSTGQQYYVRSAPQSSTSVRATHRIYSGTPTVPSYCWLVSRS